MNNFEKFIVNLQYFVLGALLVAQCVVGKNFVIGQSIYLVANGISVLRSFLLRRPHADKIKDICCLALTIGLLLFNYFS